MLLIAKKVLYIFVIAHEVLHAGVAILCFPVGIRVRGLKLTWPYINEQGGIVEKGHVVIEVPHTPAGYRAAMAIAMAPILGLVPLAHYALNVGGIAGIIIFVALMHYFWPSQEDWDSFLTTKKQLIRCLKKNRKL